MKKTIWLGALLLSAAVMHGQESRQDVSVSAIGIFAPQVNGNSAQLNTNSTTGFLASYRYMLTPRSALELNYSFAQYTDIFRTSFYPNGLRIHARQQELTGAYVYNMNFRRINPFLEAGVGGFILTPIRDFQTQTLDTKQNTNIGALFGAGVAYELSPSYDIRVQYRGFLLKSPNFGIDNFKTNRYEIISMPTVGVAYHF
ncbi:outer membrane beta-barrel protein [Terriglobus saanensis]|nr:outer membrane beta-barrel protein [Terriglobus saanensis]